MTYGNTTVSYNPTPLFSSHVRFGFELQSPHGAGRDYNTSYHQGDTSWRGAAAFDQYGVLPRCDSVTVFSYKIAQNADIGEGSGYPNSNRGTRYFYEHFFSRKFESILYYETDCQHYAS